MVSMSDEKLTVGEGNSVQVTAILDSMPNGTAAVWFAVSGGSGHTSSCSGVDFIVNQSRFDFKTNTTTASITLTACDDTDTNNENVTLSLTTFGITGLQLGSPIRVVVRITDDDIVDGYGL